MRKELDLIPKVQIGEIGNSKYYTKQKNMDQ